MNKKITYKVDLEKLQIAVGKVLTLQHRLFMKHAMRENEYVLGSDFDKASESFNKQAYEFARNIIDEKFK